MIAIHTKFIYPTNARGARVKALIRKHNLDWNIENMRYGDSADNRGFSFCFDDSKVPQ